MLLSPPVTKTGLYEFPDKYVLVEVKNGVRRDVTVRNKDYVRGRFKPMPTHSLQIWLRQINYAIDQGSLARE